MTQPLFEKIIASPLGDIRIVSTHKHLRYVNFAEFDKKHLALEGDITQVNDHPLLLKTEKQLGEYFARKRKAFDVPIEFKGTVFQQKAWRALQAIGYGATMSYGEQAAVVGDKNKARPVGVANSRNPICIIVPCHRVIGASGSLTGYAGGLKRKEQLLALER